MKELFTLRGRISMSFYDYIIAMVFAGLILGLSVNGWFLTALLLCWERPKIVMREFNHGLKIYAENRKLEKKIRYERNISK